MSQAPPLLAVVGPTATGKTALAVQLAQRFDGELVGADSVQVYRGFDIGSAKPTACELQGITHHLIDCIEPTDPIDAARYAMMADQAIADVVARGRLPIVVGGTGLWLRALFRGLVELPPVDAAIRAQLEQEWHAQGPQTMHRLLAQVDPISASTIHPNDRIRIVRALEVYRQMGRPLGELRQIHALGQPRHALHVLHVDLPAAHRRAPIATRVRSMLERGFADEVRGLIERYGPDLRTLGSVGYRQMSQHVIEDKPLGEVEVDIVQATQQYAKRQRTWFASDPDTPPARSPAELCAPASLEALRRALDGHPGRPTHHR